MHLVHALQVGQQPRADKRAHARAPERRRAGGLRGDAGGRVVGDEVDQRGGAGEEGIAGKVEEAGSAPVVFFCWFVGDVVVVVSCVLRESCRLPQQCNQLSSAQLRQA